MSSSGAASHAASQAGVSETGGPEGTAALGAAAAPDRQPWKTVVWDDPVNLMSYVTFVFRKLFGFSTVKAKELMMQVHTEGKAVVSSGDRERMEHDASLLQGYGLWATVDRS